jgi:hypothetical protein
VRFRGARRVSRIAKGQIAPAAWRIAQRHAAAGSFYALAPFGGYNVMLVSWLLLWILLARCRPTSTAASTWPRRSAAASSRRSLRRLAFGVVLFQLYRGWPPETFPVFKHFVAWSMAYLPGLYVLLKRLVSRALLERPAPILALAPMQEVTDGAFWTLIHKYGGADVYWTEYFRVHSTSTPRSASSTRSLATRPDARSSRR